MKAEDVARIQKAAQKAADEWIEENGSDEKIREGVRRMLDARTEHVVAGLAGFNNRWGTWEIDRCNGRQSCVSYWVESKAGEEVKAWLEEQAGDLPKLSKAAILGLRRYYSERLVYNIREQISERAKKDAARQVLMIMDEAVGNEEEK